MKRPALFSIFFLMLLLGACVQPFATPTATPAPTATQTRTPAPSATATQPPTPTFTPLPGDKTPTLILSMMDNGYRHLFAYAPAKLPLTRLTSGQWDDISPAISADGSKVVFASNRNEYWDLYTLNLADGQLARLTDTPEYDGNPGFSPDGQWVIYETQPDNQLEINLLSTVNGQVIQLISDPALDQTPVWSPLGRQVAFVSNRSGDDEIWLADLDKPDEGRFTNLSRAPLSAESHPAWAPDGTRLAWASKIPGEPDGLYVWDSQRPEQPARLVGMGDWPAWNPSGNELFTRLSAPNQDYLTAYSLDGKLSLPVTPINTLSGFTASIQHVNALPLVFFKPALLTPTPLVEMQLQVIIDIPGQRASIIKLLDVEAPQPYLHDAANEAYSALRQRVIQEAGWDALASLESAYTPLTAPLDPGDGQDWLYTGRAIALNPLTLNAGWMVVMREEFNGQTYWRIYLRAVAQDGSQGEPLRTRPWELTARYNLDPVAYEQGGAYAKSVPGGFWIDFTALAREYGWQRLPALSNWRSYFKGTQFNEFIITGGLDWRAAMLQLYPPDIFVTPTVVIPPTKTPTITPTGYRFKTATPTITETPTMRPTFTPSP